FLRIPQVLWPATYADGQIGQELRRSDIEDISYVQVYDTIRSNRGDHIIISL
ncbi:14132_t:CDS:1, partial [Gigaspora rosea]